MKKKDSHFKDWHLNNGNTGKLISKHATLALAKRSAQIQYNRLRGLYPNGNLFFTITTVSGFSFSSSKNKGSNELKWHGGGQRTGR